MRKLGQMGVVRGLALGLLVWAGVGARAQAPVAAPVTLEGDWGVAQMPLWDGVPPGGVGDGWTPTLTVFTPQAGRGNGTAVIIAPGGGYAHLSMNLEGRQVADWFAARGVTAFVLRYRLGAKNLYPAPLEDGQRAVRLVRSMAGRYRLAPDRVGMLGFSAGGHLAAEAGVMFHEADPNAADPLLRFSDRPDFLVLAYAWLNAMQPSVRGMITYCSVLKTVPPELCSRFDQQYTPALHVTGRTPPAFLYATTDDRTVPVSASVEFYQALTAAGVDAELHLFRHGAHGSGLGMNVPALDVWPALLEQWMRDKGYLPAPVTGSAAPPAAVAPAR